MEPPHGLPGRETRFIVGIDLGTTNSAVAYVDRQADGPDNRRIRCFDVPQLVTPGEIGHRSMLPSFLYLPGPYELPAGATALPWDRERDHAVGEFAREQGALVPGRLVASAKSWLCHAGIDRTAPILPWGAGREERRLSPVAASARILQHLREAWNEVMARGHEEHRLEEQLVLLTVPASFDEVARELTVAAAHQAGLARIVLLEEPLAAFYAWLARNESVAEGDSGGRIFVGSGALPGVAPGTGAAGWPVSMAPGHVILVCDVGGGTTDFTVVAVREGAAGLRFDRLAVGDHLMLGGDNMDLTLARHIEIRHCGQPGKLDPRRWHQLCHQCRRAKETLLASPDLAHVEVTVLGSGGKLIADTLKESLQRDQVEDLILTGFFPDVPLDAAVPAGQRTGLTEWGLPYVQDAAVTRHLASFWRSHEALLQQETGRHNLFPDFLLFNGGALIPVSLRRRIRSVVQRWFEQRAGASWDPQELENPSPELAVAMGAAYYGLVRSGAGIRVGAGSPRTYYVGVAPAGGTHGSDITGERAALCLVPRGMEEGFETELPGSAFEVVTNRPVAFQLYSSSTRLGDRLGAVVSLGEEEVSTLPPIRTVLRFGKKGTVRNIPVHLAVLLSEVGTLKLWCQAQQSPHRWQLQFDVRALQGTEAAVSPAEVAETLEAGVIEGAQEKIRGAFHKSRSIAAGTPERLAKELVSELALAKEQWSARLIRQLADTVLECRQGRALSPQHEARWFNLLGFLLRPGFGDPLDEWRLKEVWKLYPQDLHFPRQVQGRSEWWVFWRRVAGGLTAGQQRHIHQQVSPLLPAGEGRRGRAQRKNVKKLHAQELAEVWMTLANCERLSAEAKVDLGRLLLEQLSRGKPRPPELWALSRLGARVPFYGPLNCVVPQEEAAQWVRTLLALNLEGGDALAHALVHLAQRTGDRARDVADGVRDEVGAWLNRHVQGARLQDLLEDPESRYRSQEQDWIFGEALPPGLLLLTRGAGE